MTYFLLNSGLVFMSFCILRINMIRYNLMTVPLDLTFGHSTTVYRVHVYFAFFKFPDTHHMSEKQRNVIRLYKVRVLHVAMYLKILIVE